jgi:V/A-type H+-transporting ATPase subunit K
MLLYLALGVVPVTVVLVQLYRRLTARGRAKAITGGLLAFNAGLVIVVLTMLFSGAPLFAQEGGAVGRETTDDTGASASSVAIGAGLAVGLAAIGAGISVGITGSAAIGSITQKPELLGRTLIYVGLAEGVAIYGLIVAFMLITTATG